jgi:hypothetical protein
MFSFSNISPNYELFGFGENYVDGRDFVFGELSREKKSKKKLVGCYTNNNNTMKISAKIQYRRKS